MSIALGIAALFAWWIGCALLAGRVAAAKGRSRTDWLLAAFLVGAVVLLILLLLSPRRFRLWRIGVDREQRR
jgi:membrane protein YdbS with pleckstrin-like domain